MAPISEAADPAPGFHRLAGFLRDRRDSILAAWELEVRHLPPAAGKHPQILRDHLPDILDQIAAVAEQDAPTDKPPHGRLAASSTLHAMQRLEIGFDLGQVVQEYSLLRECLLRVMGDALCDFPRGDIQFLNAAIDYAITQAVTRYTQAQQRTLAALDRISLAGIESADLDSLLERLLRALVDLVPAVDTAGILLREDGQLVSHAAVGIERGSGSTPFTTAFRDDSFAGAVAAEGRPTLLRNAAGHPLVTNSLLRDHPVRVLFGVPLFEHGEVIGVAHIGSLSADDFADQDKRLFEVMCHRASAVIAQHTLREQLRESEERFRASFDQAAIGIAHVTPAGQWLRLNPRFCEMLGYSESELRQLTWVDITHPDDLQHDIEQRARLLAGELARYEREKRYIRKDGSPVWVRGHASLVRKASGEPAYVIVAAEDISPLKEAEAERDCLLVAEQQARRDAEAAIRTREEVLAVVSHDLRNPAAAIRLSTGLLARRISREPDAEPLRKIVQAIQQAGDRLEYLISDLVDMTRLRTGRFELTLAPEAADSLIEEARALHQPLAQAKDISLSARPLGDGSAVLCERGRVLQVFANLLGNAIKFCEPGQSVTLGATAVDGEIRFEIADTGPGIAEADLGRLFEPFWSAEHHAAKGTGLGLAISKRIVDAHRGRIWAESTPGAGTRFFFTLPKA